MALEKKALKCAVHGMILGVEERTKKDGTAFRLVRFSDEAGNPHEAVEHDATRQYAVFKPAMLTLTLKWGEWDGRPYVNLAVVDMTPDAA